MSIPRRGRAGLTLLELLVSLALLALIATGLSGSMSLGLRIWERSSGLETHEEALILRAHLRNWTSQMAASAAFGSLETGLRGDASRMRFVAITPLPHRPGALALDIELFTSSGGLSMVLKYLGKDGQVIFEDPRRLSTEQVRLSYFDGRRQEWVPNWEEDRTLPSLIRIEAVEETLNWPPFVAATTAG